MATPEQRPAAPPETTGVSERKKTDALTPGNRVISVSQDPSPFSNPSALDADPMAAREFIALAAYYRAERRGFEPGHEIEDWLEAERELVAHLPG